MPANFEKIPAEQQKQILDACVEEFALHGYAQASTNAIVKKARIPKGTLFYFFEHKKKLFLYILDLAVQRYTSTISEFYVDPPSDLFERLLFIGRARMQFVLREPMLYRFFFNTFLHTPDELKQEVRNRYPAYAALSREMLLKDLDLTRFKPDVEIDKAYQLILSLMEGIFSRYLPDLSSTAPDDSLHLVDRIFSEVEDSFEMLKSGLYR